MARIIDIFTIKREDLRKMIIDFKKEIDNLKLDKYQEQDMIDKMKPCDLAKNFEEYYGIDLSKYKNRRNEPNLPYHLAGLFSLMVNLVDININDNQTFYETITNSMIYNKKVIKGVAELPKPIRKYIRSKREYKVGYTLTTSIELILERIGVLMVSTMASNYVANSGRIFPMRDSTDDTTIDELDKFIDKFSSVDYWHEYGSELKIESKYFNTLLKEIFEEFRKYNFEESSTAVSLIKKYSKIYNESVTKYKKVDGGDNVEKDTIGDLNDKRKKEYNIEYLERFIDECGLNNYPNTRKFDIKIPDGNKMLERQKIDKLQMYKMKRFLPYTYEHLLTNNYIDFKCDEFEKLDNEYKSIFLSERIKKQYNVCMGVVREQLYLSVVIDIICECVFNSEDTSIVNKIDDFVLLIKSSFDKLCKLGEYIAKSDLNNISSLPTYYKLESIFNDDNFEWESVFNKEEPSRFECRGYINKLLEAVPFIGYLHNPLIEREDFNSDLNDEYKKPYLKEVDEYSQKITKKVLERIKKYNNWEEFADITTKLIIRYSDKLFQEYIKKEKYKSAKYFQYKDRYNKKIEKKVNSVMGEIFLSIAEEEMKKDK